MDKFHTSFWIKGENYIYNERQKMKVENEEEKVCHILIKVI